VSAPVDILGIGAEGISGLSPTARSRLDAATFLAGGRRHLAGVPDLGPERFAIGDNVAELVERLRGRGADERCVVLASGDPLFYGIGHRLGIELGRDQIRVEPAVSSMQLAFARAGLSWQGASLASIHGRPLGATLRPLLGRGRIGLFTQDGASPGAVASYFLDRGLDDYTAWVAERLGAPDERVVEAPIAGLVGSMFDPLNFLILERNKNSDVVFDWVDRTPLAAADDLYAQPDAGPLLLTHADVRAVTLTRFRDVPPGPIWDIGAGLGGVAVDLARAFPAEEVVACERSPTQLGYLRQNRSRFAAHNLRIVEGEAPGCLDGEPPPAGVFLGGSGGRLDAILDLVLGRLGDGGVLVANFVGLENLARFSERVKAEGWPMDVTMIQVSQGRPLAGLTTLLPLRPVWIVRTTRGPG